jgi:small subunit ribosomal protein S16
MLTIRLTRKGRKNQPFFKVVVIDKRRASKGGRAVDIVGHIDPLTKKKYFNKERILHWIKNGAKPSDTVHNFLISEKIIEGKKIHVARVKKSAAAATVQPADAQTASAAQPADAVQAPIPPAAPEAPQEEAKEAKLAEEKKEDAKTPATPAEPIQ